MMPILPAKFRLCLSGTLTIITTGVAWAWEPTAADLEEAFLLWATPRVEYSGKAQDDAYAMLMTDSMPAARVLPRFFSSPSGSIREKILTLCENLGAEAVGAAMRPHVESDSPNLALVLMCLARSHDRQSLPILLDQLKHPRWTIRSSAALALGYLADSGAIGPLAETLKTDEHAQVRKSAVFSIGKCMDSVSLTPEILDRVCSALDDVFFATRFNAARAMAEWSDPAAAYLLARYDSLSDTAKYGALYALGRCPTPAGREFLEKTSMEPQTPAALRGIALKGLLDRKWTPADAALTDIRSIPVGRGLLGILR